MNDAHSNITIERKHSHVELCLHADVRFDRKTSGFEQFDFRHNALPEIRFSDVELSTTFLGRKIGAPLMISSMTGGYDEALRLNRRFAEAAEHFGIPLGIGSMRQALENSSKRETFSVVRKYAPSVPVFANIGAPEVAGGLAESDMHTLVELVEADALIVHLNAAQELFQPEGNTDFRHVLDQLERLCATVPVPVIAKEVGCGISGECAQKLLDTGVRVIDVAGAGGISWQKVEELRYLQQAGEENRFSPEALTELLNWGIPTARCIIEVAELKKLPGCAPFDIIASGGISSGMDIAKSLALGAGIAASAGRLLVSVHEGKLEETIETWLNDLRAVMFLTGSASPEQLQKQHLTSKHRPIL
ncbi:MAG: type 2 isopentenyl-diphosphate Delta-isomerase [Chlorobi bacterium]|nr:type 2 isopentenyl-diphosphate Delta-isomerase [Chlorobiota bacterium]